LIGSIRHKTGVLIGLCVFSVVITACGNPTPQPTPSVVPIQSAVAADATLKSGPSGTATLIANVTQQPDVEGVGNPGSPLPGSIAVAPCSLLNAADISVILNVQMQQPVQAATPDGAASCTYAGTGTDAPSVSLIVYEGNTATTAAKQRLDAGQPYPGSIGDQAALTDNALMVRVGSRYFSISVHMTGQEQAKIDDLTHQLAVKIVPRLSSVPPVATAAATGG